jgi:hypothetical protein
VRKVYNHIVLNKFRALPRLFKKSIDIQQLFNDVAIDVQPPLVKQDATAKEVKLKSDGPESNAMKVSKMVDDFLAKITGSINNLRRTETALSGSQRDDSREDLRDSFMSHLKPSKSKKSMMDSKSDLSSDIHGDRAGTHKLKDSSESKSIHRHGTLPYGCHDD